MTYALYLGDDLVDAFQVLMDDFLAKVSSWLLIYVKSALLNSKLVYLLYVLSECFIKVVILHAILYSSWINLVWNPQNICSGLPSLVIILLKLLKGHKDISRVCSRLP